MDNNNESDDDGDTAQETQKLFETQKQEDDQDQEKLCRIGWQVKYITMDGHYFSEKYIVICNYWRKVINSFISLRSSLLLSPIYTHLVALLP